MFALHELSVSFRVKNLSGYGYSVMVMLFWGTTQTFVLRGDMLAVSTHTHALTVAQREQSIKFLIICDSFWRGENFSGVFKLVLNITSSLLQVKVTHESFRRKKKLGKKVPWTVRKPKSDQPRRTLGTVLSFTEVSFC